MRLEHWAWYGRSPGARLTRRLLWAPSVAYQLATRVRAGAYLAGVLPTRRVHRPVVAVGSLHVGGAGKTPLASWIAAYYAARGVRPAIALRGYGADEGHVHRRLVPGVVVLETPDRVRAARRAIERGAQVIVLDDAFQRLDIHRDLNLVLIAAESLAEPWRLFPAGPWREPRSALRRAHSVVITRKRADARTAAAVAERLAGLSGAPPVARALLEIAGFVGLRHDAPRPRDVIAGQRVAACCGIADPMAFAAQLRELGADVRLFAWRDHHRFRAADVRELLSAAARVDYVVMTAKDAVKLRRLWPQGGPEPLVAQLQVVWEDGRNFIEAALTNVLTNTYGR